MPVGVDDAAAAAAGDVVQVRDLVRAVQPGGVVRAVKDHVAVDEVAPALERDVLHGGLPLGVVVRVRRDVERHALFIQRRARQRHIALPADEAAHRAPRRVHDREIPAVGVAPDHALGPGGLELAVHGGERAVRAEDEVGVVERARYAVALRHADAHIRACGLCRRGEALRLRPGHDDGVVAIQLPVLAAVLVACADREAERHAVRVAGDEQLREHDELRAVVRALRDQTHGFVRARGLIKQHRRRLHHGDAARRFEIFHMPASLNLFLPLK